MSVTSLRQELKARNINSKGLKSQLAARLGKTLKSEAEKVDDSNNKESEPESETVEEKKTEVIINLSLQ